MEYFRISPVIRRIPNNIDKEIADFIRNITKIFEKHSKEYMFEVLICNSFSEYINNIDSNTIHIPYSSNKLKNILETFRINDIPYYNFKTNTISSIGLINCIEEIKEYCDKMIIAESVCYNEFLIQLNINDKFITICDDIKYIVFMEQNGLFCKLYNLFEFTRIDINKQLKDSLNILVYNINKKFVTITTKLWNRKRQKAIKEITEIYPDYYDLISLLKQIKSWKEQK